MNKAMIIILSLVAFIGGFILFYNPKTIPASPSNVSQSPNMEQKWELKNNEQANVAVTVTPTDLGGDSKEWKFDVVMSTHSVELDQDMLRVAVLIDNLGKEYKPLGWEGAEPGGHHREGTLVFAPINPYPQDLTLIIKGIGGKDRTFSWVLKK